MRFPDSDLSYSHGTDSSNPPEKVMMDVNKTYIEMKVRKQGEHEVVLLIPGIVVMVA